MKTTLICLLLVSSGLTTMAQQTSETEIKQETTPTAVTKIPVKKATVPTKSLEQSSKSKRTENQAIEPKKGISTTKNIEL